MEILLSFNKLMSKVKKNKNLDTVEFKEYVTHTTKISFSWEHTQMGKETGSDTTNPLGLGGVSWNR